MAKPQKVEEPAAPYLTSPKEKSKPAPAATVPAVRYADSDAVRKSNKQLMQVHRKVLQKLAQ